MLKCDLKGKVALVTGGTGGIGSSIVEIFAANGAQVYFSGRNEEKAKEILAAVSGLAGEVRFLKGDVSSEDDCRRIVETIAEASGGIDILVNNAGGNIELERRGKIYQYYPDAWVESIDKCMDGDYYFIRFAVPYMIKRGGGRIINLGSVTGFRMGLRIQCAYNVAKAAIHNWTRSSAIELAKYNITVNCVIPGSTWHKNFAEVMLKKPGMREKFLSHVPVGIANAPEDMANAVLYFASEEGARTTGVLLNVDGGWASGYCKGPQHDIKCEK